MTYYLIAFYVVSTYARTDFNIPVNLGKFDSKEACVDASHRVSMMLKSRGGTALCVQTK